MKVWIQVIAMGLLISSNLYADEGIVYFSVFNCAPKAQDSESVFAKAKILSKLAGEDQILMVEFKQPIGMMIGNTMVLNVNTEILNDETGNPTSMTLSFNETELLKVSADAEGQFVGSFDWGGDITPIVCKASMLDDSQVIE